MFALRRVTPKTCLPQHKEPDYNEGRFDATPIGELLDGKLQPL